MARRPLVRYGRGLGLALAGAIALYVHSAKLESNPFSAAAALAGERIAPTDSIAPAGTLELSGLQAQFETVARRVGPSVVAISASLNTVDSDEFVRAESLNGENLSRALDRTTRTVGTGFVIDPDGYILTNEHVVGEAEQLWITTDDHKVYPAIVIGSDPRADLAVLKIPAKNLCAVTFSKNEIRRGHWTIALGNPYGLAAEGEMAMSVGVVSAIDRSLPKLANRENRLYTNLIQTTAEINPGNSGGPLFNLGGEVIGINTAVILPQKQTNGIGFAMPITRALLDEVDELKQGHEIIYAYVGVSVITATDRERRAFSDTDRNLGVRVDSVEPDSPATNALKADDVIISINGEPISDSDHFVRVVGRSTVGEPVEFRVYRAGHRTSVTVTPRKRRLSAVAVTRESQRLRWRGLLIGPVPAHWKSDGTAKASTGLIVVGIDRNSPMVQQGVTQGSVITSVAGTAVSTIPQLQEILNSNPEDRCAVEVAGAPRTAMAVER